MISTRLDALPQMWVRVVLLGLALLVVIAARLPSPRVHAAHQAMMVADVVKHGRALGDDDLYVAIRSLVADGMGYYEAAVRQHRAYDYPLKPFMTVRLPTLAVLSATIGGTGTRLLFAGLALAAATVWLLRAKREIANEMAALVLTSAALLSASIYAIRDVTVLHEAWAGLLITLSLGLWRPGRWSMSVALGLLAALFREHANIYLLAMAGIAVLTREWRESAGWIAAVAVSAACLMLHARGVASVVDARDLASQGWQSFGGLPLFMLGIVETTPLLALPRWLADPLVVVSVAGWAVWRSPLALRVLGFYGAFAVVAMLFARPDNFYWSWLVSPFVLSGLVLAVLALPRSLGLAGIDTRRYLPGSMGTRRTTTSM